jgi:small subunit ribosomal protein S17
MDTQDRSMRKVKKGIVVSNKMEKTVVVKVERTMRHPQYGKVIRQAKKYYAHDPSNSLNIGDEVAIVETRPLSKLKRWRVVA